MGPDPGALSPDPGDLNCSSASVDRLRGIYIYTLDFKTLDFAILDPGRVHWTAKGQT